MHTTLTFKLDTLYAACSVDFGVVSYGHCQDEALNNLTDELREHGAGESTGHEGNSHAVH
jgi:hypothetical protein